MQRSTPLAVGENAPQVYVASPEGPLRLAPLGRLTLVWFFRGRWCPFCNTHLAQLTEVAEQLRALTTIRIVCCEPLANLTEHANATNSAFPLLSDPDFEAIDAFGVRHVGAGPGGRDTSRPAYFIVDREGQIAWAHVGRTPTDRPSVETLLGQLRQLAAQPGAHR